MAITPTAPTGTPTGVKSATAGTTVATGSLSTVAGNAIYVAITSVSVLTTVSSISDGGTNTYDLVAGVTNGTTRTELWKARGKPAALASATITGTLSASGSLATICVYTYSNVAYQDNNHGTNTGSSAAPTTGAQTLQESADYLIAAIGVASATALSAPTGTIEEQTTTTGVRGGLLDHTGATSETCAATSGNAAWAVVWVVARAVTVTADTLSMSDADLVGYGNAIPDVIELLDADSTGVLSGIEDLVQNGFGHWSDNFRFLDTGQAALANEYCVPVSDGFQRAVVTAIDPRVKLVTATSEVWSEFERSNPPVLTGIVADTMTITDGTVTPQNSWLVGLYCPHMGLNWNDVFSSSPGPWNISIVDVMQTVDADNFAGSKLTGLEDVNYGRFAQWQDVFLMAITNSVTGVTNLPLGLLDGVQRGTVTAYSASTVTNGLQSNLMSVTVSSEVWTDVLASFLGGGVLTLVLSDNEGGNWNDSLGAGYGNATSDQMSMSDFTGAGYGSGTSDQLIISDSISSGYGALLSDNEGSNWADSLGVGYGDVIADQLSMSDSLGAGYGDFTSDQMTMSDFTGAGYGSGTSDQMVIVDSLGAGYGGSLSDNEGGNWNDSIVDVIGFAEVLSDNEGGNWNDSLGAGYGNRTSDQMSMSDFTGAGYGSGTSDQLVIVDSLGAGYGALLSDNLNNWADSLQDLLSIAEIVSDQMSMSDFAGAGYGSATSDQLVIVDSLGAGYGGLLSDSLNNWQDSLQSTFSASLVLSDSETANWNDSLGIGYGDLIADQLTLVDGSPLVGNQYLIGIICPHLGSNWADLLSSNPGQLNIAIIDLMDVIDTDVFLGTNLIRPLQDINNGTFAHWTDVFTVAVTNSVTGVTNLPMLFKDGFQRGVITASTPSVVVDGIWNTVQSLTLVTEVWTDVFASTLTGAGLQLQLSDNEGGNWSDSLGAGYGNATSDQMSMADFTGAGYGSSTSDQLVIVDSISSGYGAYLTDTLNNWLDLYAQVLGFGILLTDTESANWADSLLVGYGNRTSDTLSMSDFAGVGYGSGTSDQLVIVDSLGAGYGALLNDNLNSWQDSLQEVLSIAIILVDSETANWADSLLVGYGNVTSDTMTMFDFTGAGYGSGTSDQLVIVDSLGAGYGALLSDNLNNWQDVFSEQLLTPGLIVEVLADSNTANWNDSLRAGYGNAINDQLSMADFTGAGYGSVTSDQLVIVDSLNAGYGSVLSDTLNNWLDSAVEALGLIILVTDSDVSWADSLLIGYGDAISEQLTLADVLGAGYGGGISDSLIIVDSVGAGYGALLSDDLNNWNDLLQSTLIGGFLSLNLADDNETNWNDAFQTFLPTGFGPARIYKVSANLKVIIDPFIGVPNPSLYKLTGSPRISFSSVPVVTSGSLQFSFMESLNNWLDFGFPQLSEIGLNLSDQGGLADRMDAFFPTGLLLTDAETGWLDDNSFIIRISTLQIALGDSLSQWVDSLSSLFPLGTLLADSPGTWLDTVGFTNAAALISLSTGDNLFNWKDGVSQQVFPVVLSQVVADNLNTWVDTVPASTLSDMLRINETILNWVDSTSFLSGSSLASIGDSLNNWSDAAVGLLNAILLTLADSLNNWADLFAYTTPEGQISIVLGENLNSWADALPSGSGGGLVDTLSMSDGLRIGFGNVLSDSFTFSDAIAARQGIGASLSDQLSLSDFIRSGYGLSMKESLNNWQDFIPNFTQVFNIVVGEAMTISDTVAKTLQ